MLTEVSETLSKRAAIAKRYAAICEKLQGQQKELHATEREKQELERLLFGGNGEMFFPPTDTPQEGNALFEIYEFFRTRPNGEFRMKDVMTDLHEDWSDGRRRHIVRQRIYKLIQRGLLDKIGRGLYRLKRDPWTEALKDDE
jgi:hypothetical protein